MLSTLLPHDNELIASIWEYSHLSFCGTLRFFLNAYRRREIVMALYPSGLPIDIVSDIAQRTPIVIFSDVIHAIPRMTRIIE